MTFVDWIDIKNGAYILVPYQANEVSRGHMVCMLLENPSGSMTWWGSRYGNLNREFHIFHNGSQSSARLANATTAAATFNVPINIKTNVIAGASTVPSGIIGKVERINDGYMYMDTYGSNYSTFIGQPFCAIAGRYEGSDVVGVCSLRVWNMRFSERQEDNTFTDIFNLRPCLYNGEYGLWDTISNTFYGNSGTGTITGGYDN